MASEAVHPNALLKARQMRHRPRLQRQPWLPRSSNPHNQQPQNLARPRSPMHKAPRKRIRTRALCQIRILNLLPCQQHLLPAQLSESAHQQRQELWRQQRISRMTGRPMRYRPGKLRPRCSWARRYWCPSIPSRRPLPLRRRGNGGFGIGFRLQSGHRQGRTVLVLQSSPRR